jgi:hypothetical protein
VRAYQTDVEKSYRRDGLLPAQEAVWDEQQEAPASPAQQQQFQRRASDGDSPGAAACTAVGGAAT